MLRVVSDGSPSAQTTQSSEELYAELAQLNTELRELKSSELAVRAYMETWVAAVSFLAWSKLVYDWQKTHSHAPWLLIPLAMFALVVFADSLSQRSKQHKLARAEEDKLKRQRELRSILGVDDAVFPEAA